MCLKLLILCSLLIKINCDSRIRCGESDKVHKILMMVKNIEKKITNIEVTTNKSQLVGELSFQSQFAKNCQELQQQGKNESGIYHIQPKRAREPFPVLCNMKTSDGGWTYILNRFDGSQDFYLDWNWYKHGFGNMAKEFWLGLDKIHLLTGFENSELLIELEDWDGRQKYAFYSSFSVGNEEEGYMVKVLSGYNGTAGDSFSNEAGMRFTTKDKDLDVSEGENCAVFSKGGWWYRACKHSHLTGRYFVDSDTGTSYLEGIYWAGWRGNRYSLKAVRMMVRPRR